jgi:hypothetical protein
LITPNEVINTELGIPYEMRNQVQEIEMETENDRVEPVGDLVVTNVGTENDRVDPGREANEDIFNEQEVSLKMKWQLKGPIASKFRRSGNRSGD